MRIGTDTLIEDLVAAHPAAVTFLMEKGIRCLVCGEPTWGTLGDAMASKGIAPAAQRRLVRELIDELRPTPRTA